MTTIHAIRHLAKGEEVNGCKHIASVLRKAADEIEELTKENSRLNEVINKGQDNE